MKQKTNQRSVKDFYRAVKISTTVLFIGIILSYFTLIIIVPTIVLSIIGFYINYTVVKIENSVISIPAHDQIRTFKDLLILNPITGYFRRRSYNTDEIENVANGYTTVGGSSSNRAWNVVITGVKNGHSFSQRIDCTNKQVRDEVRNVLKQVIKGNVNSEFSY